MGRPPKPWYWKQAKIWCVTLDGRRIKLDTNKDEAVRKFHALKAEKPKLQDESLLVVIDELLTWTQKHRRAGTFRFYKEHAEQIRDYLKEIRKYDIACNELTPAIFEDYLENLSKGRRAGAVQVIKRVYNWGMRRGRITTNPIMALEKPAMKRRKNLVPDHVYEEMVKASDQNLTDLLTFCWHTAARPQEA